MRQRAFWIVLAIVVFYLIARPRIGTLWYVNTAYAQPTPASLSTILANASEGSPSPSPSPPTSGFPTRQDCLSAVVPYEELVGMTGIECRPRYGLLWGW